MEECALKRQVPHPVRSQPSETTAAGSPEGRGRKAELILSSCQKSPSPLLCVLAPLREPFSPFSQTSLPKFPPPVARFVQP